MKHCLQVNSEIDSFINISRELGKQVIYVQGGGGNTSYKVDSNLMLVKASGIELSQATESQGFVSVNYHQVRNNLLKCLTEDDYTGLIKSSVNTEDDAKNSRPSIETGFHAFLPFKCILHSHSIFANILTCSLEGLSIVRELFPEAAWIPYAPPGLPVTLAIAKYFQGSSVIFMENHGVIVGSDSALESFELHEYVSKRIKVKFKLDEHLYLENSNLNECFSNILFPDQIVYLQNEDLRNTKAGKETILVFNFLMNQMKKHGLNPKFLSNNDVHHIISMESEKYRQKVASK